MCVIIMAHNPLAPYFRIVNGKAVEIFNFVILMACHFNFKPAGRPKSRAHNRAALACQHLCEINEDPAITKPEPLGSPGLYDGLAKSLYFAAFEKSALRMSPSLASALWNARAMSGSCRM